MIRICAFGLFALFWVIIGWQDFQQKKIRHLYLGYGMAAVFLGYAISRPCWPFYQSMAGDVLLCAMAAVALWMVRVWPAGDAKLFIFLALLYPLMNILGPFQPGRMFLIFLINIFIPASIFVFIKAWIYIYSTRLRHFRDFVAGLGWRKEFDFLFSGICRGWVEFRLPDRMQGLSFLRFLGQWLLGMACMSLISYYLRDFFHSPILLSLLCMVLFFIWNQINEGLGRVASRLILGTAAIALLLLNPPTQWGQLGALFGNVLAFSLFMYLGMNWTMRMIGKDGSMAAAVLFPLLISFLGLAAAWLWRGVVGAGMGMFSIVQSWSFAADYFGIMGVLAMLGLFFGLSLVLVRKWDEEARPSHSRENLEAYLMLAPSFVERLRQDPEFFESNFSSLYADGITGEQAQSLKEWCRRNEIERVPLAPTMSFGFWIFFGFLLSLALGGRHVLQLLL